MEVRRTSGMTKFIKNKGEGSFILLDGIGIVVTGKLAKYIDENSTGEIRDYSPTTDKRKKMLDKLFSDTDAISKDSKIKVKRESNSLKFIKNGITESLIIDDEVKISGTKEFKYLFDGLEYKEKDGVYSIDIKEAKPQARPCKIIMNRLFEFESKKKLPSNIDTKELTSVPGNIVIKKQNNNMSINQIFYGPPGTGKTYKTVNAALKIIDPDFYYQNKYNRPILKNKFDEYVKEGRIGFVTFHQSFSYEDFVEGLRAEADDDGHIQYSVQDGIFKQLCEKAIKNDESIGIDEAIKCLIEKMEEENLHLHTIRGNGFTVNYRGGRTFRIKPDSSDKLTDYPASIENIKKVYRGFSPKDVYNPSYVLSILEHLKSDYGLSDEPVISAEQKPVVLIIDEINRGNTANIFGELITLIEPSKRAGAEEALSVVLPYSKEPFSVPDNLHIIGTMNTADRSLALIDTALRRRFQFEEILPDASLLSKIKFEGINIQELLTVINKRIALLYDREHTLGHSFFMSLNENSTVDDLKTVFNRQILPLLEEYFFEDWEKIRQVLGDPFKSEDLQVIKPEIVDSEVSFLLGDGNNNNMINNLYTRNDDALSKPEAYIAIYTRAK